MPRKTVTTSEKVQKAAPVKVTPKTKVPKPKKLEAQTKRTPRTKVQENNSFSAISTLSTKMGSFFPAGINLEDKKAFLTNLTKNRPPRIVYVAALLIGLSILVSVKKGWFIAATVNNTPINNLELQLRLDKQYRSQLLSQMINEQIILNEAKKNSVTITDKDIADKLAQIEQNVGGQEALSSLLTQQGQTLDGLRNQLRIQIIIEKLYSKEATVSAEEVNKFIDQNKDSLQATDSAGQIKEATDLLQQQKLTQLFQQKFQELKTAAKIQIF